MKKILVLAALVALVLGVPSFAQGPPPGRGTAPQGGPGGPGGPPPQGGPQLGPDAVLKEVLALSDDQSTALRTLLDTRRQATEAIMPQLADAEKALADALKAATPDAATIGTLLLGVQGLRTQLEQVGETFQNSFNALLTTAQQQKVAEIRALDRALQAGATLRTLGI
jgi:Spy/CpxP family protein refolding chaperone